jgi:hypothetical protein
VVLGDVVVVVVQENESPGNGDKVVLVEVKEADTGQRENYKNNQDEDNVEIRILKLYLLLTNKLIVKNNSKILE